MTKKSNSKPDKKDVFVKSKVHTWSTDLKEQEKDVKKLIADEEVLTHVHVGEVKAVRNSGYHCDFTVIDGLIDDIKKEVKNTCVSEYACNNITNFLSEALKKIKLAEK